MTIVDDTTTIAKSTMPTTFKRKAYMNSVGNYISLASVNPMIHSFSYVPDKLTSSFVYGVESVYNIDKNIDITEYINRIGDNEVYFSTDAPLEDGDYLEVIYYTNGPVMDNKFTWDKFEQVFRLATHMDRCDFGNYVPPYDYLIRDVSGSLQWSWHEKLLFNQFGWERKDTLLTKRFISSSSIDTGFKTILQYSPYASKNVGTCVLDRGWYNNTIANNNEAYYLIPSPLMLTGLKFLATKYNDDKYEDITDQMAIQVQIDIDGNQNAIGVTRRATTDNKRDIINNWGDDSKWYMSMAQHGPMFGAIPSATMYGENLWSGTPPEPSNAIQGFFAELDLGLIRANEISVRARIVGPGVTTGETVDKWYILISGFCPKRYT